MISHSLLLAEKLGVVVGSQLEELLFLRVLTSHKACHLFLYRALN